MCWLRLQSHRFFLLSSLKHRIDCSAMHRHTLVRIVGPIMLQCFHVYTVHSSYSNEQANKELKKNNNKILLATSRSIMFAFFCAIQYYLQATSTQHCYCFSCCRFHIAFFTIRAYVFYYYVVACHFFSNCHGYCCCVVESSAW